MRGREVAVTAGAVVLVVLLVVLLGGGVMGWGMMGWGGPGAGLLWWLGMVIFWALAIGGIVALVVWLIRSGQSPAPATRGSTALEILRERYARGEINREEYEQMRRDLEAG